MPISDTNRHGQLARFARLERHFAHFGPHRVAYALIGRGPVVMLVHGLGGSADFWQPLIRQLEDHFTLVCPDLLGFGLSDKPRLIYTLDRHIGALCAVAREVGVAKPLTLVAHSIGGVMAVALAATGLVPIERMVLADSAYPNKQVDVRAELVQTGFFSLLLRYRWLAQFDHSVWRIIWPLLRSFPVPLDLRGGWSGMMDHTVASYYSTVEQCLFAADLDPLLPRVTPYPTLLLHARDDRTVPFSHSERLHAMLPHSQLMPLEGGHYAVLRAGAEPLARWLVAG